MRNKIIKNKLTGKALVIFLLVALGFTRRSIAQDANRITLHIGDVAPAIKYSKWIKGEPLTSFNSNKIYVLEFWATWCGPCRAAMPHLTKLQKQYEGKILIIGVDIWEDEKKGEPYETFLPKVEEFVKQNTDNMGYPLFADNNDQYMGNNWMKAAGQQGIPSTFIVKNGKIIWIGDPMALDTTLPAILDHTYNMAAFRTKFENSADASQKMVNEWLDATKPVREALAVQEYKKAIDLIEKAITKYPDLHYALSRLKFRTLLKQVSQEEAISFGIQWQKQDVNAAGTILDVVSREDSLFKSTYLWAAKIYQKAGVEESPFALHSLAGVYAKGGDLKNAIMYEEKAVKSAEAALQKSATGAMTDKILSAYKQDLKRYKKNGK